MTLIVIAMGVPRSAMVACSGHETAARFHQPARQEAGLADRILAVALLHFVGLFREVERLSHRGGEDHLPGLRRESIHIGVFRGVVKRAVSPIHRLQKSRSTLNRGLRNALRQAQIGHFEPGL